MRSFFLNLYNLYYKHKLFFPKKTYSCWGEDLIVENFFKNREGKFYVDVGCYHPLFWNNTYLLYKKQWRGINIDINPVSIKLFKFARKDDYNFNLAVTNKKLRKLNFFIEEKLMY